MNHSTWRTRRVRQLAAEAVEYDQEYVDARLAGDLGQAVYDRRIELGLSQAELADRAGMTQPQVSRMEGGDTVPTPSAAATPGQGPGRHPEPGHRRGRLPCHLHPARRLKPNSQRPRTVIGPGPLAWCPRQDSNLRHPL
jgi:hypothetical protein